MVHKSHVGLIMKTRIFLSKSLFFLYNTFFVKQIPLKSVKVRWKRSFSSAVVYFSKELLLDSCLKGVPTAAITVSTSKLAPMDAKC